MGGRGLTGSARTQYLGLMESLSQFHIPKMDCPSEERLIRLALEPLEGLGRLEFDLSQRRLRVIHGGGPEALLEKLVPLGFGATLESSGPAPLVSSADAGPSPDDEVRVLKQLLGINASLFAVELVFGVVAQSTGLLADSLDMLADAMVYTLSLLAVGAAATLQRRAAHTSGVIQFLLGMALLGEVARRALNGSEPEFAWMVVIALVALVGNLACVGLLAKHRTGGVHLEASWIFTTNDALANVGVILAGVLVAVTGSALPDLLIGAGIGLLVLSGALRILRLR